MHQVTNNTKEQAMMGGFSDAISTAVIDSLDVHQNLATQLLGEELKLKAFANVIYEMVAQGLKQVNGEPLNNHYEPAMKVAEPTSPYGKEKGDQ